MKTAAIAEVHDARVHRARPSPGVFFGGARHAGYNGRMVQIHLNGEPREVETDTTIVGLLDRSGFGGRRVAVEINREIVPRSVHAQRVLREGDRVEIVHALGGG